MFSLLLPELSMSLYVYVMQDEFECWTYDILAMYAIESVYVSNLLSVDSTAINIHNKDNLDRALLLISLGLPHKEIEELLNDNN